MRSITGRWLFLGMGIAGALLVFLLLQRSGKAVAPPTALAAQTDYVDSAECATCHRQIANTYRKTGMARSFYKPSPANVGDDFKGTPTLDHKLSGLRYVMEARDGKFFERRSESGYGGLEANVREESLDYIIGSGNHARTYLHRSRDGKLLEMPVSWYTEHSGTWAMSPGYDQHNQEDFRRAITPECMFCHNGYPQAAAVPAQDATVFPATLPEGIDCQRCHGPGRAHIAAASSGQSSADQIRAAIVNPARLSRDRQLEVCMQCHLETSSSHMPNEIRAWGREVNSFRPGQPLGDYKTYFTQISTPPAEPPFEIVHAATRMRLSRCFRESQMTCITCHNPHDIPRGEAATAHYIAVCQGCHTQVKHTVALPASETCLSCHMPKRRTEDAVHVVMTDHFIQRVRPSRDLLAPLPEVISPGVPGAKLAIYYPTDKGDTRHSQLLLAVARVEETSATKADLTHLQQLITQTPPTAPEPYLELGRALARTGANREAIPWFEQALSRSPDSRPATQDLVLALFATGGTARAVTILEKALARNPGDPVFLTNLGNAYLRLGRPTDAHDALNRANEADPEAAETNNLLGLVALNSGDKPEAERRFREAIRLQTDSAEPQNNLANLLTGNHDFPEAAFHFTRALTLQPDYAAAHHGYGLLLILTNDFPRATTELREATRLDPADPQAHSDLADLLAAQGQIPAAADQYREVLRLKPEQHDAQLGLGIALLRQGHASEARLYLQRAMASDDPGLRQAAQEALSQIQP